MHIQFAVVCDACGQRLATDGETYRHNNDADCDAGSVTLPKVSVDDLRALLHGPTIAALNGDAQAALAEAQAEPTKKRATKPATKKGSKSHGK